MEDPELQVPGNAGLKDQVLALKWVKRYISFFNGDSNNITVFGESAGAASTHYMLCTQQTRHLFHKAILMSGCVLNNWAITDQKNRAYRLAKFHGYEGENVDKLVLQFLRGLDYRKLVQHDIMTSEDRANGGMFTFGPCVEPYIAADCIIPVEPLQLLKNAWGNEIPIIMGGVSFEGLLMYPQFKMFPQGMNKLKNNPERVLPKEVRDMHNMEENKILGQRIVKAHFGNEIPSDKHFFTFLDVSLKFFRYFIS